MILFLNINQWKKLILLGLFYFIGFFIALIISVHFELNINLEVVKFIIPLLIFVFSLFLIHDLRKRKKGNIYFLLLMILLFSFFNGLGVFTILENDILGNVNSFLPVLLCVFGAVAPVVLILSLMLLMKLIGAKFIKWINYKWPLTFSVISSLIALYFMIGKVFE